MKRFFNIIKRCDWLTLVCVFLILSLGCVTLYSASYQRSLFMDKHFVQTQIGWILIGLFIASVIIFIPYKKWIAAGPYFYIIGLLLLVAVLFFGPVRGGARRWLTFAGITFQPSEMIKIGIILVLSSYLGQRVHQRRSFKPVLLSCVMGLLPCLLVLKQPNLGIAASFLFIVAVMLWVWGIRWKHTLILVGTFVLLLPLLWFSLEDYQRQRILIFLNPGKDPLGSGYNIMQSKIAVGSGGLFGKGWMSGTQNRLNFTPERHTDFIFSVLSEEFGFVGAITLILLFAVIFYRCMKIALQTQDISARLLIFGVLANFAYHTVINIAMTIGIVPVVGIPLPLVSYGGSNMVVTLASIGIVLNISARRTVF
jgi:rod shape determining protein RodA